MSTKYDESAVKILEGLEPVKLRPGQFTRTDSPLHIVQEAIDNAVDEAIAGFAKTLTVTLEPDGYIVVADDGRGIPVGKHPEKGIPVVEAIFTILYSGGKFDKKGAGAYTYSGGLHGVGVSVTNALSASLECRVRRDGHEYEIAFADGDVARPLRKIGKVPEGITGTTVRLKPNPKYFDSVDVSLTEIRALLKSKAALLPGFEVTFDDVRGPQPKHDVWKYDNGIASLLDEMSGAAPMVPVIQGEAYINGDAGNGNDFAPGEGASWCLSWYENGEGTGASFVNLIPTPLGGTHVNGLRQAVFAAVRNYIDHHSMLPKGVKVSADDCFKQARFVLSVRMLDPSFENQTKDRLSSRDGVKLIDYMMLPRLEAWLNHNPAQAKTLADIAIRNAVARQRSAKTVERKRGSGVVMLPGKLADCESSDPAQTELFLVEGDSAGGSAKMGRDKETQAILAMRGKGLNVWERDKAEALANEEIHDIATAIGIQPHTATEDVDFTKLRYGKIAILADADVDGYHIQTLLLTLFFKHFPQLIRRGHIFVARPPLFRIDAEAAGKKRGAKKIYAMDQAELSMWEERLKKEGYGKWRVGRFKGLGEMDPPELWETTLNPDTRRLLRVRLADGARTGALEVFDNLMAKNKADWRRQWMERRGHEVEAD